jgi:ATP-binding cassette subfamily A (ABC1) protein 3
LFDLLTVREHLDIYCDFKGLDSSNKNLRIEKIMKDVDVWKHRDTMAKSLSGGNKRKLSVALALVADSKLVLLDEPTSGMDLTARRRLWGMLKDYK